jgi:TonB family protein
VAPFAAVQAQDQLPADVDATMRAAISQKNHDLLDGAASAFIDLRKFDTAQKLLETSLSIREQVSGNKSAEYAAGLLKLGDLAVKRSNTADAEDFYRRAVALGDTPEAASALVYLGTRALLSKDPISAKDLFQRALRADPVGPQVRTALMWLARIAQLERDTAQAETLYQQAESTGEPDDTEAVLVLNQHALFLQSMGRDAEADELRQRAATLRSARMARVREQSRRVPSLRVQSVDRPNAPQPVGPRVGIFSFDRPADAGVPRPQTSTAAVSSAYRVGNGVSAPALLFKVEPSYSDEARALKVAGTVTVQVIVNPDGTASDFVVLEGLGYGLDEKAIEAISRWKFRPGTLDGNPVPVLATIEVNFRLL